MIQTYGDPAFGHHALEQVRAGRHAAPPSTSPALRERSPRASAAGEGASRAANSSHPERALARSVPQIPPVSAQQRARFDGSADANVKTAVSGQHPTSRAIRPGS